MPLEDKAARRRVEHEMSRHSLDFALASVAVINQVAYFGGRVRHLRSLGGHQTDLRQEMRKLAEAVRLLPGIREVVVDCHFD